jgi:hypothetical protein
MRIKLSTANAAILIAIHGIKHTAHSGLHPGFALRSDFLARHKSILIGILLGKLGLQLGLQIHPAHWGGHNPHFAPFNGLRHRWTRGHQAQPNA